MRQGRVPADALVSIEAVTDGAFVPAGTLEAYQSLRDDAALEWQSSFTAGPPPLLTALLVGINIRVWWAAQIDPVGYELVARFTNWTSPALESAEVWRPLTMGILHTDLFHVVMNMLWLAYTGWNIERALGRRNLLTLYVASVLGGSLLSMFFTPTTPSLGASGGVFGLVAASVAFGFARPELLPQSGRRVFGLAMLPYLIVMFGSGLTNPGTDNWSHFGGLMTGGLLALTLDPEPLQRRPGWNRLVRLGTLAVGASTLAALALAGPRLMPLADHREVERRQLSRRAVIPFEPLADEPLAWHAPVSWEPAMSAIGVRSLRSPSPRSHRIWGVHEVREDAPLALEALGERWSAELKEAISTAEILGIEPLELAGEPGLIGRARIDDGEVLVEWRAAVRGLWVIETVWEVDDQDLRHLEPLHRRLLASVTWAPPPELAEARAIVERNPRSRTGRLQLARALAETGDVQGSLAQYEALIAEEPRTPDIWSGLLALSGWYPAEVASADSIRERALAANPYPATLVDIVDSLEAAGQSDTATGLLELAWVRFPSDSKLRRARRTRGLPVDTLPESGLPRHLALGEDGRLDERTLHAWQERPLTLEQARLAGAEWRARREALTERLRRAVHASHEGAIEVLFLLRDGAPPDDPVAARAGLAEEMVSLELRGSLRWLPSEAATLLLGSDVQKALAAEVSEEG